MKNRKIQIAALAAVMSLGILAVPAAAEVTIEPGTAEAASVSLETEEYKNIQQAAAELKLKMLGRQQNITVKIKLENANVNEELNSLLKTVYAEDPLDPAAGDYLRQNVLEINVSYQTLQRQGNPTLYGTFTFSCVYSSNQQQENYVTLQVKKIISDLKLTGKTDDDKILEAEFKLMAEELGVDNFRIHDLRHSMATAIVNQSGDIFEAQRYLGHKHISTTKGYLHSTPESRQGIVDAMNKYLQ